MGGKTAPHRITSKKGLAFNGIVRKAVNHPGSVIPARPFLQLTTGDEEQLLRDVAEYLENLLNLA